MHAETVEMSDLYDTNVVGWSEHQADLLRRHVAGERANDPAIDWPRIIEEIEDVGRSKLRSCKSLLRQALRHMLKAEALPLSRMLRTGAPMPSITGARRDAFTPSMRQKIDAAELHADAMAALPETLDGTSPLPVQTEIPALL